VLTTMNNRRDAEVAERREKECSRGREY